MTTEQPQGDLFTEDGDSVYATVVNATGLEELEHLGNLQLPTPLPTELEVSIYGWHYVYKLDRRYHYNAEETQSDR